jgi:hypothetical protein
MLSNLYPNVYEIDLPAGIKARRFLNASRLIKTRDNPIFGQLLKPEDPVVINEKLECTVDKILSSRVHHKLQYQAAWQSYNPDLTWYNAENFKNSPVKLQEFHEAHPASSGPPVRLKK